jgi:hypothetical protein
VSDEEYDNEINNSEETMGKTGNNMASSNNNLVTWADVT